MNNIDKCPYCGNTNFVEGIHCGYASVKPADKIFTTKEVSLYHVICLECGTVVMSYVKKPEKLLSRKKKKLLKENNEQFENSLNSENAK